MMFDLFETSLCAALELDPQGVVTRVGKGWGTVVPWRANDGLLGRPIAELCVASHRQRFERALQNLARGAPSAVVRARFQRPGNDVLLSCRLEPVDGRVVLVADDVTEQTPVVPVAAEVRSLVEYAMDCWFVHDLEGRIIDANPYACESLGYTRDELLALQVADFETTIQPGRMDGVWNRMELGKAITVAGRHRRKDGSEYPVEVKLGLFSTEDDDVLMLAIARDVTDREQQQLRLAEANAELSRLNEHLEDEVAARTREVRDALAERQAVLNALVDGVVAVDERGLVQFANPALHELLQVHEELCGHPLAERLPAELARLIEDGMRSSALNVGELMMPGDRVGAVVVSPVERGAMAAGAVAVVRDVTLEREVDRMKTDFIATVSHELRTPLTSVLGFAKLIKNKLEQQVFVHVPEDDARAVRAVAQVRGNIDIVISEGERLTALINDVLDISKMEGGHMEWKHEVIDPAVLVSRALEATQGLFGDERLALLADVEPGLPELRGDLDRLQQVLINLISNAAKFTEHGGVTVAARLVAGAVEFSVTDTGVGVAPDEQDTIFEKFKQVGDTLTSRPRGTGLGLPICRQIVHAHDGAIWVESGTGQGSRFAFTIPLPGELDEAVPGFEALLRRIDREVQAEEVPDGTRKEILVVDDDPALRELLRQQLGEHGYVVREATDGYEAIETIRQRRPDLVILDVMMPHLSGFDVAAMLKSDPRTEAIPIIILSILADRERGLRLGVDRYLTKPTSSDELDAAIRDLLRQSRSPRRVLVVDDRSTASSDIARVLESKGYTVVGTCTGRECLEQARRMRPQMIIVEQLLEEHQELVRTIRFEKDLRHVLVVQMLQDPGVAE